MRNARKTLVAAAVAAAALGGVAAGTTLIGVAGAQESSTSTSTAAATATPPAAGATSPAAAPAPPDPSKGGHVGANGVKEELLTGDTAAKVRAAALAAVPGGTIQRVENDAEGAAYEAHMLDASGNQVTVKLDAAFSVTSTEAGMR